ncbi:MAG: cytochrome P450, partial [Candidatus Obscuribacterales bacterium]|nr:cytochrome P450 [Candidatus Obscuribacterales bacterium]
MSDSIVDQTAHARMRGTMVVNLTRVVPAGFETFPVLDLRDAAFHEDVNGCLRELRKKSVVCRIEPLGVTGLLKWNECDTVLRDFKTFSAEFERSLPIPGAEVETKIDTLLREDPPKHTRVRALMQQAFTPQRVNAMEPHTREITRRLIDKIFAQGNECEFVHQFGLPLPSTVMSGLLGVDESMMESFKQWADSMMGSSTAHAIKDEALRKKRYEEIAKDAKDMEAYLQSKMEERKKQPQHDLISYLIQSSEGGDRLTEREVLTLCKLAVIAGNDLTTKAIVNALDCMMKHPEQMKMVADDLSLAANAFEESLRYFGPVIFLQRQVLHDTELAGIHFPKGAVVAPIVASANHDEDVFEKPEVFDIRRKLPRILSFSSGNHQCIGQPLARLEARVAFEEWFARVSSFSIKGDPEVCTQLGLRGYEKLGVSFEPRTSASGTTPGDSMTQVMATADKIADMSDQQLGLDKRQTMT